MPLSLPLFISQPVPCEAEWHPKVEGKDDDCNSRVNPCPGSGYNPDYPGCLQKRRDKAIIIPGRAACVCVCVFQSCPRSQKMRVPRNKPSARVTPHLHAMVDKFLADLAPLTPPGSFSSLVPLVKHNEPLSVPRMYCASFHLCAFPSSPCSCLVTA